MKRIQYHQYGGPGVMRLEDFQLDKLEKDEVAVKVKFSAINPIDWKVRNGMMKIVTGKAFPRAMGMDLSGTVIAVGSEVTRFMPGDAVFGLARFKEAGALGEAVIAKETALAKKPECVSFEDAACLGSAGATAWTGLIDKAHLRPGQHVFVNGCAGAVGEAAVQIARLYGAVVSGCCHTRDMARATQLGVQSVFDYRATRVSMIEERFDVVYDTAATMTAAEGFGLLRKGGVFLDLNPTPGKFIAAMFDRRLKPVVCTPTAQMLDKLAQAARDDSFKLRIGKVVHLSEAIALITALEAGRKVGGKSLVAMD